MAGKNTSEGTKVSPGKHAPMVQEGAGAVAPGSLAAESIREGGGFASNRNITSTGDSSSLASTEPHEAPGSTEEVPHGQGRAAPSYANGQFIRDGSGPHGENITEAPGMTGRPSKFSVEVGSAEDPGREAVHSILLKQTRRAPGTGEREIDDRRKGGEQPYSVLRSEASA